MSAEATPDLAALLRRSGIKPRLGIDQMCMRFESARPIPACTAHAAIRKTLGGQAQYFLICHGDEQEDKTGTECGAYRLFTVALHDLTPDPRRKLPGISLAQIKAMCSALAPAKLQGFGRQEIFLDLYESTPLADLERAEIGLTIMLCMSEAVGMPKLMGSRDRGEEPLRFKGGNRHDVVRHLCTGYSVFTSDAATGRELKCYPKAHDTLRQFNESTLKFETIIKAPLPICQHRMRLEWTLEGQGRAIRTLDDLEDLKPLASLFYANQLTTISSAAASTRLKPPTAGNRRKKPHGATSGTSFNKKLRDAARAFKLRPNTPKCAAKKDAVKINLKTPATEGKQPNQPTQSLITVKDTNPLSASYQAQPVTKWQQKRTWPGRRQFTRQSLAHMPLTTKPRVAEVSSLPQLGHASLTPFDT